MPDETDSERIGLLKPKPINRHDEVVIREDLSQQLAFAMKEELHTMIYVGMIGNTVTVDPDRKGVEITTQRFLMTTRYELVFIPR